MRCGPSSDNQYTINLLKAVRVKSSLFVQGSGWELVFRMDTGTEVRGTESDRGSKDRGAPTTGYNFLRTSCVESLPNPQLPCRGWSSARNTKEHTLVAPSKVK